MIQIHLLPHNGKIKYVHLIHPLRDLWAAIVAPGEHCWVKDFAKNSEKSLLESTRVFVTFSETQAHCSNPLSHANSLPLFWEYR